VGVGVGEERSEEAPGVEAELKRCSAGASAWWRGVATAAQRRSARRSWRECDGLRVWGSGGGAGGWEGAQRIGGGLKEAGRGSRRGSKEGNPGELGGIQARALRCGGEEAGRRARAAARGEGRWLAGVWA